MTYECRLDGDRRTVEIGPDALATGDRAIAYVDTDAVSVDGHTVTLTTTSGSVVVDQLARRHEEFVLEYTAAWRRARRAALLQWTGDAPIDEYETTGDDPATVVLFADGLTVERWHGAPAMAPFALIDRIDRDGYTITIHRRAGLEPVTIRQLGRRTDEFLLDVDAARAALTTRTLTAYAALAPDLAGFAAPDGWAVSRDEAGAHWAALRRTAAGARSAEVDVLEARAGGALRIGIKASVEGQSMPFVLAPANGKIAVEGTAEGEARATFVFATDDVAKLNAVLLLTSFRREAISFPEDQLGRWAVAVRLLDIVQWARAALVARVVHDDNWKQNVTAALQ